MDISKNKAVLSHLIVDEDFLEDLKEICSPEQISQFVEYSRDVDKNECPDILDDICDYLIEATHHGGIKILSIAWDSTDWGPGGSGFFRYNCKYGLVMMSSSDYEDDHVEIFDRDKFSPWGIDNLENDYIDLKSTVYSENELIDISKSLGVGEHTKLTINGREM